MCVAPSFLPVFAKKVLTLCILLDKVLHIYRKGIIFVSEIKTKH